MMKFYYLTVAMFMGILVSCTTSHEVTVDKTYQGRRIRYVAQAAEEDNSAEMNGYLAAALQKQGLTIKPSLPQGTRTAEGVDAVVSYVDVWRWDVVMYLQSLTLNIYDPKTGNVMATGHWRDSPLHGFRDPNKVMNDVVSDAISKVHGSR
jgi:hypothetical protein